MEKSGIVYNGRTLKAVKESLNRLATTSYTFNNCFYYNPNSNILNREIKTKILSITKHLQIIQVRKKNATLRNAEVV